VAGMPRPNLSRSRLAAVICTVAGFLWKWADRGGRIQLFWDLASVAAGPSMTVTSIVTSSWFSTIVLVGSLGYLVLAKDAKETTQSRIWQTVIAIGFYFTGALMFLMMFGYFAAEPRIRYAMDYMEQQNK
jgi:hypothetical protein